MDDVERCVTTSIICHPDLRDEVDSVWIRDRRLRRIVEAIDRVEFRTDEGWVNAAALAKEAGVSFEEMEKVCEVLITSRDQALYWIRTLRKSRNLEEMRETITDALRASDDIVAIAAKVQELALYYEGVSAETELSTLKEDALGFIAERVETITSGRTVSITTGLKSLDRMVKGFRPGELTTLVAGPGVGKTTFAFAQARRLAEDGKDTLFFSGEMTEGQTGERTTHAQLLRGMSENLTSLYDLEEAKSRIQASDVLDRILIDHRFITTPADIRSTLRSLLATREVSLVVYDHLQHMEIEDADSDFRRLSEAAKAAKGIAKSFRVPFLLLTHLSRARFQMEKPSLEMIRGSGLIEDISDNVISLWKVEDFVSQLYVLKARQGQTGDFPLRYDYLSQTYTEGREL